MIPILYLAPVEWSSVWQRPQHLAVRLNRSFRVHYVDPVGLRSVRLRDLSRVRRAWQAPREAAPLPVIQPRYFPWQGSRVVERANRRWLMRQLAPQFNLQTPWILWLGSPSLLADELLERSQPSLVIYDAMDRFGAFHRGRTRQRIERTESKIVARADLVFTSSHGLAEHWSALKEVTLVPNGVDAAAFRRGRTRPPPAWRRGEATRVIGFYGTLGDWLDYDLLFQLARRHAEWQFVFIGPIHSPRAKALGRLSNTVLVGPVRYADLAEQAVWFDAALVPFRLNELTRYVHPLKALEYLALGLPVVSARLPDLREHADVISFASTIDEWSAQIEAALARSAGHPHRVAARRRVAQSHDWDQRVKGVIDRIEAAMHPIGQARQPEIESVAHGSPTLKRGRFPLLTRRASNADISPAPSPQPPVPSP